MFKGLLSLKTDQAAGDGTWDSAHARKAIPITAVTLILPFKRLRALHYHWSSGHGNISMRDRSSVSASPFSTLQNPSPIRVGYSPASTSPLVGGSNCWADPLGVSSRHHLIVHTFTTPLFNCSSFLLMPIMFFFLFFLNCTNTFLSMECSFSQFRLLYGANRRWGDGFFLPKKIARIKTHTEGIPTAHWTLTCFPWGMTSTTGATKPTKPTKRCLGHSIPSPLQSGSLLQAVGSQTPPILETGNTGFCHKQGSSAVGGNCTIVFHSHTRCVPACTDVKAPSVLCYFLLWLTASRVLMSCSWLMS